MGIPDHLTCLLRNLYAGQEATVGAGYGTRDWFPIGKGVRQGCHLAYLTYMQSTSSKISKVTIYSLDVLLSQFGTSLLFHVQF